MQRDGTKISILKKEKKIKDLKWNIEMQKDSTKIIDKYLNKLNKDIKNTKEKLKLSINKNREQQIIIDTLRKEIKKLKEETKNIESYKENSVQRSAKKAAAKAAKINK